MKLQPWIVALSLAAALVGTTGCATKKYVRQETGTVNTRVDDVQGQVEEAQTRLNTHDKQIGDISKTAQDALTPRPGGGQARRGQVPL